MIGIAIERMGSDLVDGWLDLFDTRAFTEYPRWAGCYCMAYLTEGDEWDVTNTAANRAAAVDGFRSGDASGVVARLEGRTVGWARFGPKLSFPPFRDRTVSPDVDNVDVGSIVCFVIDPAYRRQGLARALLEAACGALEHDGFDVAEAYPVPEPGDDAHAFHGPLGMYIDSGFTVVAEIGQMAVVQRPLR